MMMNHTIEIGIHINLLSDSEEMRMGDYYSHMNSLKCYLEFCSLPVSLESVSKKVEEIRGFQRGDNTVEPDHVSGLNHSFRTLVNGIMSKAEKKSMIILDTDSITEQIRELPTKVILEENQKAMFYDMIHCVETGLYRPAIVMAWNLCYDFIRSWICKNGNTSVI